MSGKNINFDDEKVRKSNFYNNKKIYKIEAIDANHALVSKKESYGNKNSLCIKLPKMSGYARKFDENVTMSFIV